MGIEILVVVLIGASCLGPILAARTRGRSGTFIYGAAGTALITLMGALCVSERETPNARESQVTDRPIKAAGFGFASSDSCLACHPSEYHSWHDSYHRRMTQAASPATVLGDFDHANVTAYDREFRLRREGDEFWVNMDDPDVPDPDPSQRMDRRIVLTTGSHHMQVYWYSTEEGRRLGQLPLVWLNEAQRWIPRSAAFIKPPGLPLSSEKGRWNQTCIQCHVTNGRPRIHHREQVIDTHVAEFGVSCEACHGPCEAHVAANRNPQRRYQHHLGDARDDSVVHPRRLAQQRMAHTCGQCHGVSTALDRTEDRAFLWDGFSYRSGDDLSKSRYIFGTDQPRTDFVTAFLEYQPQLMETSFWSDGMVRVSGREYNGLVRSPCFQRGDMTCLSCHQLHPPDDDPRPRERWADDQLGPRMETDEACLQCHASLREPTKLASHTHHGAQSSGSRCYNCHMPHTTYGLLKAIRSHEISVPQVRESTEVGRPNACNQCHIDKSLEWTAGHLQSWYGIAPPAYIPPDERTYAASILWCLKGDAGQRAVAAWTLGWQPALDAARHDWAVPVLGHLLDDPYDAVRYIAHRSLLRQPGFQAFRYDFVGPRSDREAATIRAYRQWRPSRSRPPTGDPSVLLAPGGELLHDDFRRLLRQRNDQPLSLNE